MAVHRVEVGGQWPVGGGQWVLGSGGSSRARSTVGVGGSTNHLIKDATDAWLVQYQVG